ncbi:MAG: hypothetical protein K8S97_04545, partial [Anaerolineae bacterium]|nr:hypothetical protein [Anaerolineae bacterium]
PAAPAPPDTMLPIGDTMQPIMQAIQALISAQDIQGVKAVIQQHESVLLTDEADTVFTQNIDNVPPGTPPQAVEALKHHRELLRLCRQNGIDTTFERLEQGAAASGPGAPGADGSGPGGTPPIIEAIQAILTAPNIDALKASIQQFADILLTDEADMILTQNIDNAPADAPPGLVEALKDRREILRVCRQMGVEEAFNRLGGPPPDGGGEAPPIMQAIQEMLTSQSAGDVQDTIRRNAHLLLTEEADQVFEQNIANVPPGTPQEFVSGLQNARQLLALCRQHGVEQAFQMLNSEGALGGAPSAVPTTTNDYGAPADAYAPVGSSAPTGGYAPAGSGANIPDQFEDKVAAGLTGSSKDKMELYNYLDALPNMDPSLRALIETAKRAVFGGIEGEGGDLAGDHAATWARIVQRIQAGG